MNDFDYSEMFEATRAFAAGDEYDDTPAEVEYDDDDDDADDDVNDDLSPEESAAFGAFLEGSDSVEEAIANYAAWEQQMAQRHSVTATPDDSDLEYEDAVDLWYDARGLEDVRDVVQNYVDAATAAGSDDPWSDGEAAFHRANEVLADEATRKGHKPRKGTFEDAIDAAYQDGSIGPKAAPKQQSAARRRQSSAANAIDDWAVSDLAPANELRKQARRAINHRRRNRD